MDAKNILETVSGDVQLALMVEGEVVPVIIGAVKSVEKLIEGETITYTVAISTGQSNIATAKAQFTEGLDLVNSELAKMGKPPMDVPQ